MPRRASELDALEQEHARLRAELSRVGAELEQVPAGGSRTALRAFLDLLKGHERREERLVADASEGAAPGA
jgi:hypothetical protein